MKINLSEPYGPYESTLDTGAMVVKISEAYLGAIFETGDGEKLIVFMRDRGFEVVYSGDFGEKGFDAGMTQFKAGQVILPNTKES